MKVIHVDMDCFYAAIEVRDNPTLIGKPVAVGGRPGGRGVVAAANYEARKFGVYSAMSANVAARKCRDLIFVSPQFSKYKEESRKIREVFKKYTNKIEPLSLDEAYLDVTESELFEGSATLLAKQIRKEIFETTQLTASAGIAPNKFLAKVASDWKKPNGQFTVTPSHVESFVKSLPIKKIPGVGKVTSRKMNNQGIFTCEDLQKFTRAELVSKFGKWGHRLYGVCRGIDNRPVEMRGIRKSLSVERTYGEDLPDLESCKEKIPRIFEDFEFRMKRAKIEESDIKSTFVKLKFFDFQTTTFESAEVKKPTIESFRNFVELAYQRGKKPVRLLGLGVRLKTDESNSNSDKSQLSFPF